MSYLHLWCRIYKLRSQALESDFLARVKANEPDLWHLKSDQKSFLSFPSAPRSETNSSIASIEIDDLVHKLRVKDI